MLISQRKMKEAYALSDELLRYEPKNKLLLDYRATLKEFINQGLFPYHLGLTILNVNLNLGLAEEEEAEEEDEEEDDDVDNDEIDTDLDEEEDDDNDDDNNHKEETKQQSKLRKK